MVNESVVNSLVVQFLVGIILSLVMNLTSNRLPPKYADPLLRWGWFGGFLYSTYLIMSLNFIQRKLIPFAGSPWRSFIVAGIVGTIFGVGYWAIIVRLHNTLLSQKEPGVESASQATPTPPLTSPSPPVSGLELPPSSESKPSRQPVGSHKPLRTAQPEQSQPGAVNQTMTNSPGGIQAGRDVFVERKPSPLPTEKEKKP